MTMRIKTNIKAGGHNLKHNARMARDGMKMNSLGVKTNLKAGERT
jgi:hypothetical protein